MIEHWTILSWFCSCSSCLFIIAKVNILPYCNVLQICQLHNLPDFSWSCSRFHQRGTDSVKTLSLFSFVKMTWVLVNSNFLRTFYCIHCVCHLSNPKGINPFLPTTFPVSSSNTLAWQHLLVRRKPPKGTFPALWLGRKGCRFLLTSFDHFMYMWKEWFVCSRPFWSCRSLSQKTQLRCKAFHTSDRTCPALYLFRFQSTYF